jgi:hypothetical protein
MNGKEVVNCGQYSASFARLCECDGKNRMNRPVREFFSNARATRNLVVEKLGEVVVKFVRNRTSELGANFRANDSIRESKRKMHDA